jgi:hypothetical protein
MDLAELCTKSTVKIVNQQSLVRKGTPRSGSDINAGTINSEKTKNEKTPIGLKLHTTGHPFLSLGGL